MTAPAQTPAGLVERILDALPQTQCTRCGYPDCAAYSKAIASGMAAINQCPPGGTQGIARLAQLTGLPEKPLDPVFGLESPRSIVFIDEAWCIGCTLCIDACPTDAIMGSNKRMHTVLEQYCTGCALCLPACPVDCIALETASGQATGWAAWSQAQADQARARYAVKTQRNKSIKGEQAQLPQVPVQTKQAAQGTPVCAAQQPVMDHKQAIIEAAMARAKAQRAGPTKR